MLKLDIPVKAPSIWERIDSLRIRDINRLAPGMQARTKAYLEDARKVKTINGEVFDPVVFETARVDELQQIYYEQGTTNAPTAIYGWHFYCLAIDVISASKGWSVSTAWWRFNASLMRRHGIDPGFDWHKPDEPHGQFGTLKPSPSDIARTLYFGTPNWHGKKTYPVDDPRHMIGLRKVWMAVGAL